jgi:xanthine dehydrogenase accessory factor
MRKLHELIVLIRGAGSVGTAVAQRLAHSHFRVCLTELEQPLAVNRGVALSEAVFDNLKTVEDITAEKCPPTLEKIYKVWRNNHLPVIVDPEVSIRPLLKPDVLVNAMMLRRSSANHLQDAEVVVGIGPGFTAGQDVSLVVESEPGFSLGSVIMEGSAISKNRAMDEMDSVLDYNTVRAEENGVFTTAKNCGDNVKASEVIGYLDKHPVTSPADGVLRGLLRNEMKVLANSRLAVVDAGGSCESCKLIHENNRAIAGGVLEAVMLSLNSAPES